jgi:hypothetical protein
MRREDVNLMKRVPRRPVLAALALILLLAGVLLPATAANALSITTGSLAMTSDPGDFVGGGQSFGYDTDAGDAFGVSVFGEGNFIRFSVQGANGDFWNLDFAAADGAPLTPGTYTGATRASFRAPGEPGLDVSGVGRGCNTLTGSFTVTAVSLSGPNSTYVERFDASFEQHCEGSEPALRGEIHVANPPLSGPLELSPFTVSPTGTVDTATGAVTIRGTVSCSWPVLVNLSGSVSQTGRRPVSGSLFGAVQCTPGAPIGWEATAFPDGDGAFRKGDAQVLAQAFAFDEIFGNFVFVDQSAAVQLSKP